MLTLLGCAPVAVYPKYHEKTIHISVSSDAPSQLTETQAGAFVVEDSQVVVHGKGGIAADALPYLFGLTGTLVQKGINASAVSDTEAIYRLKFDTALQEALARNAAEYAPSHRFEIIRSEDIEDIWLRPSALFNIVDGPNATLSFQVVARFDAENGGARTKTYWAVEGAHELSGSGGWADENAALFKKSTETMIERLAQVILLDIAGNCGRDSEQLRRRQAEWKKSDTEQSRNLNLLCERDGYFVTDGGFWDNIVIIHNGVAMPVSAKQPVSEPAGR